MKFAWSHGSEKSLSQPPLLLWQKALNILDSSLIPTNKQLICQHCEWVWIKLSPPSQTSILRKTHRRVTLTRHTSQWNKVFFSLSLCIGSYLPGKPHSITPDSLSGCSADYLWPIKGNLSLDSGKKKKKKKPTCVYFPMCQIVFDRPPKL